MIRIVTSIRNQHRRIAAIVEGLDEEQLNTPVLPSGWTVGGMLVHLRGSTQFWCRRVLLGDDIALDDFEDGQPFVLDDRPYTAREIALVYLEDVERALDAVAGVAPDGALAWWPEGLWGSWRLDSAHDVVLHLLVETSTHAGHLDTARELLDGATFDYAAGTVSHPTSHPTSD